MPFIFPRRYIQVCLDTLRPILSIDQHSDLVRKLNQKRPERLPAMWEAVTLAWFTNLPEFAHEEALENGRRPDFQFVLPETGIRVVGDITSVSDKGPKKDNPIEQLIADIGRIAKQYGSDLTQFHVQVDSDTVGEYRKRKVILKLPKGSDHARFLKNELTPYIKERLEAEDYGHKKTFASGDYNIEVTFNAKSQYASYGHPSFTSVLHIDRNPVWNALKAKADQLRGAPSLALRLLILCDGGCEAMRERGLGQNLGRDEIVRGFLKRETGIDIVIAMTVKDQLSPMGQSSRVHHWSWSAKDTWLQAGPINQTVATEIQAIFNAFGNAIPKPASNPESAAKNCLTMDYGIGAWGGCKMTNDKIEISVRALQSILAGKTSIENFNRDHNWPNENRFATTLSNGQTISNISMTRGDKKDDDYVEITFAIDAALSPFK